MAGTKILLTVEYDVWQQNEPFFRLLFLGQRLPIGREIFQKFLWQCPYHRKKKSESLGVCACTGIGASRGLLSGIVHGNDPVGGRSPAPHPAEHDQEGAFKVGQTVRVQEGIDQGVGGYKDKVKIAQPMNRFTATGRAQVHQVDHDHGRGVARQERDQHDQIGLGEFAFGLHGSLVRAVRFIHTTFVHLFHLFDLIPHGQENAHVREDKDEERAEEGDVGENESVRHETDLEENGTEAERQRPDDHGHLPRARETHVCSVPHWRRDGKVAIYSKAREAQQRSGARHEIHELR